jgi:hypothetical protein
MSFLVHLTLSRIKKCGSFSPRRPLLPLVLILAEFCFSLHIDGASKLDVHIQHIPLKFFLRIGVCAIFLFIPNREEDFPSLFLSFSPRFHFPSELETK